MQYLVPVIIDYFTQVLIWVSVKRVTKQEKLQKSAKLPGLPSATMWVDYTQCFKMGPSIYLPFRVYTKYPTSTDIGGQLSNKACISTMLSKFAASTDCKTFGKEPGKDLQYDLNKNEIMWSLKRM